MNTRTLLGSTSVRGLSLHYQGINPARLAMGQRFIPRDDDENGGGGDPPADDPPKKTPEELEAELAAIRANHQRLQADAKRDRDAKKAAEDRLKQIEDEKAEADRKAAEASGNVEEVKKQVDKQWQAKYDGVVAERDELADMVDKLLKRDKLSAALDELRVKPELKKAAMAYLGAGVELNKDARDEDGFPIPYRHGLPLLDSLKLWANDDEGKPFILAGDSGGEAPGGKKNTSGRNPWKKESWSLTEQDTIEAKDPQRAQRLKTEAGVV